MPHFLYRLTRFRSLLSSYEYRLSLVLSLYTFYFSLTLHMLFSLFFFLSYNFYFFFVRVHDYIPSLICSSPLEPLSILHVLLRRFLLSLSHVSIPADYTGNTTGRTFMAGKLTGYSNADSTRLNRESTLSISRISLAGFSRFLSPRGSKNTVEQKNYIPLSV